MYHREPVSANRFMTTQLEMVYNGDLLINDVYYKLSHIEKQSIEPYNGVIEQHVFKIFLNRIPLKRLDDKVYNGPSENRLLSL